MKKSPAKKPTAPPKPSRPKPGATKRIAREKDTQGVIEMVPLVLSLQKILVPFDFSDSAEKAVRYAAAFARQFGARVTLLHVRQLPYYPADLSYMPMMAPPEEPPDKMIFDRLKTDSERLISPDIAGGTLLRVGAPFDEIAKAAAELDADLIVVSTHGYTGIKHALLGSTAERVVRHAPCPVLVVREKEHEFA